MEKMDYPKKLIDEVKERSKGMQLEGIKFWLGSPTSFINDCR